MTVAIDVAKLKRQRREFGDAVMVLLADCDDPNAIDVLEQETDFDFASGDFAGHSPMKAGVAPSPDGPVFILEPAPPQVWAWLEELARRLEGRGISGRLTAAADVEYEPWFDSGSTEKWIGASAYYPGWYYKDPPRWAWGDQTADEVPLLAARWCQDGAERAFLYSGILSRAWPADLPKLITMTTKRAGLVQAYGGRPVPLRMRSINFNSRGFVGCLVNNDLPLAEKVAAVSTIFTWRPDLMSHAFIRRFLRNADPQFINSREAGAPLIHPADWCTPRNADLIDRLVLDAHAMQLLTTKHLERATNLDAWTITEIAPDRHIVQTNDLDAWLANDAPDPDLLTQARHDFGPMIATTETIEELRNQQH